MFFFFLLLLISNLRAYIFPLVCFHAFFFSFLAFSLDFTNFVLLCHKSPEFNDTCQRKARRTISGSCASSLQMLTIVFAASFYCIHTHDRVQTRPIHEIALLILNEKNALTDQPHLDVTIFPSFSQLVGRLCNRFHVFPMILRNVAPTRRNCGSTTRNWPTWNHMTL